MRLTILAQFGALAVVTVVVIAAMMPLWSADRPATCWPDDCFCEAIHEHTVLKQPVNALSSLAYALVGVIWLAKQAAQALGPFDRTAGLRGGFAVSTIVIGVGSAYYHASLTFSGQFLDVLGMYLFSTLMLVYVWRRQFGWSTRVMWAIFALISLALAVLLVTMPELRRSFFGVVLVLALVFEGAYIYLRRPRVQIRRLMTGLALFALAYAVWLLDTGRIWCNPDSILQGHAAWHLLGASASHLLLTYYRSENTEFA